jgi:hypothetical protein
MPSGNPDPTVNAVAVRQCEWQKSAFLKRLEGLFGFFPFAQMPSLIFVISRY